MSAHGWDPERRTFYRQLGRRLLAARERRALSQTLLGARTGISQTTIANIEGGVSQVTLFNFLAIARELGVEPTELFP